MLSAANFIVGILLLRNTVDADYGLYVMAFSTLLLVSGVQGALIQGPMVVIAPKKTEDQRLQMVGGLFGLVIWAGTPIAVLSAASGANT